MTAARTSTPALPPGPGRPGAAPGPRVLLVAGYGELADQVEAAAGHGPRRPARVEACADLEQAGKWLAHDGPWDLVVAGPALASMTAAGELAALRQRHPEVGLVLAFPRRHRVPMPVAVRTGAADLVYLPAGDEEMARAVGRGLEVGSRVREDRLNLTEKDPKLANPGTVITVASATGGCGKTFLATNLAAWWAGRGTGRVCLLDLDLQFGEVATALRLRPRFTIADALALRAGEEGELDDHLEEYLVDHETGVSVLVAPRDPAEADRIEPADVGRVIDLARRRFDVVVVDTPSALTEVVLTALDRSDVLYTLATLDTPSVRNLGVFLHTLERLRIPSDNVRLVLNKAERDVGIGVDQVARLYPQGFDMVLPYAREVTRSINVGMPVLTSAPRAEISRLLTRGFSHLLPAGGPGEAGTAGAVGAAGAASVGGTSADGAGAGGGRGGRGGRRGRAAAGSERRGWWRR